jgi:hypothetical protein
MLRLVDVVRRHGPAYMERHGAAMMPSHVHAVKAILRCRTPEMGGHCVFRRDLGSRSGLTWAAIPTAPGQRFR